jgi:hypothetical protein
LGREPFSWIEGRSMVKLWASITTALSKLGPSPRRLRPVVCAPEPV